MGFILFIVFLVLKLTKTIDWSWVWVTSPLWISFVIYIAISIISFMFAGLVCMMDCCGC